MRDFKAESMEEGFRADKVAYKATDKRSWRRQPHGRLERFRDQLNRLIKRVPVIVITPVKPITPIVEPVVTPVVGSVVIAEPSVASPASEPHQRSGTPSEHSVPTVCTLGKRCRDESEDEVGRSDSDEDDDDDDDDESEDESDNDGVVIDEIDACYERKSTVLFREFSRCATLSECFFYQHEVA
ncbi:hypothetical protein BC937DRAFT_86659 [Endogone sp. FLAS-F59071]|nr:hypothetical protein BC937DRAFT_86659 [Endogone sp. FLAS-F59071]|eukprot:RUS12932.1 hypothetical protein BC937DRAFT_86659 [Endogone sp. FLAS-F59071]